MKKIVIIITSMILLISLITGCNSDSSTLNTTYDDIDKIDKDISYRNTEFAFEIFKELNNEDKDKNIFISPFSISTALTMTYQGAKDNTKESMTKALKYDGLDIEQLNESYKNLIKYLNNIDDIDLNINNSIWIKDGEKVNEGFLNKNKDVFDAHIKSLDFSKDSSADEINEWIDDSTNGKIKKMINPPISKDTFMYLINAIYFKGDWSQKFDEKYTTKSKFFTEDGLEKEISMMSRNDDIEYGEGKDYKVVRLPYGNEQISMYIMLPNEKTSINDFIGNMNIKKWNEMKMSISKKDIKLKIPKFKMEYGIKNLNKSLLNLGMEKVFSDSADFSGIREDIFISEVLHKAVIEVNESGSEAAGVTVIGLEFTSAILDQIEFIADRPFLFIIGDDKSNTILFMGKYYDID